MSKKARPRIPKVRIARPNGRPFQLRYFCPNEQREIRISTGTRDEDEVDRQKRELEAKLTLGIPAKTRQPKRGQYMLWEDFREEYRSCHLVTLRDGSADGAQVRLDVAERIVKPRTLADMADEAVLHQLQTRLLAGKQSRHNPPRSRSPHTVKNYMRAILAALSWAHAQKWLPHRPTVKLIKTGKLKHMKGRPITTEEFERLLAKTPDVVGPDAAGSWQHVLQGLWTSALRIDELMHVSWDIPHTIQPVWHKGRLPVLMIPEDLQKNATEEAIPLLPWFEAVLLETLEADRTGWVFEPEPVQGGLGGLGGQGRPNGKVGRPDRVSHWAGCLRSCRSRQRGKGQAAEVGVKPRPSPELCRAAPRCRRSARVRAAGASARQLRDHPPTLRPGQRAEGG